MPRYVIDTSSIIVGAPDGDYPMSHFRGLWDKLEALIEGGELISCQEVFGELGRKDEDLHAWAKARRSMFWKESEEVQRIVTRILTAQPRLIDVNRVRSMADPFVVAQARAVNAFVISQEKPGSAAKPKVPEACAAEGVRCLRLAQVVVEEGWRL